jgi:AraC-like DNA-binding protein
MQDSLTRVFEYNGRKLLTIMSQESYAGERVVRLPMKVVEWSSRQPISSMLLPCRIGYFPRARGHRLERPAGDWAYTMLLCLDGEGWLEMRDARVRMTRGSLALLRPFEFHAYRAADENPWSIYWIHFNGRAAGEYYDILTDYGRRPHVSIEPDVRITQSFESILEAYSQGYSTQVLIQASTALHHLFGCVHARLRPQPDAAEDIKTRIQRAISIMRENPASNASIHEFAAATNMSRMYFAAKFREETGETPRMFFSKVKMQRACELLRITSIKIENIAQALGYTDAFYFSRVFKRITGMSPKEYRRSLG